MARTIFITGTGTDIGKTTVSLALALWALRCGLRVAYYKPVQCGTFPFGNPPQPFGDAPWMQHFAGENLYTEVTYTLTSPVSPHLAAEKDGVQIDLRKIADRILELGFGLGAGSGSEFGSAGEFDLVIVEGAGGVAVPFNRQGEGLIDIAKMVDEKRMERQTAGTEFVRGENFSFIVATSPGLGTLHHTLTTVAFLRAREINIAGLVFCHREENIPENYLDNVATLESLTGLNSWGALPFSKELNLGRREFEKVSSQWIESVKPAFEKWFSNPNKTKV